MSNVPLAATLLFALLFSALAYRAVDAPKSKDGMVIFSWRVFAKGLAGGGAFIGTMLLGIMIFAAVS